MRPGAARIMPQAKQASVFYRPRVKTQSEEKESDHELLQTHPDLTIHHVTAAGLNVFHCGTGPLMGRSSCMASLQACFFSAILIN